MRALSLTLQRADTIGSPHPKFAVLKLSAYSLFECGDLVCADLADDASEFLDAFTEPRQFLFANLVMFRVTRFGVGFLQFLEHGALAAIILWPDTVKATVKLFGKRTQEGDVVVVGDVKGQREQQASV